MMRTSFAWRAGFLSLCAGFGSLAMAAVEVGATPVWGRYQAGGLPFYAVTVDLQNKGDDAKGVIEGTSSRGQVTVPVDMPRQSEKTLTVYVPASHYGQPSSLSWRFGRNQGRLDLMASSSSVAVVGTIGTGLALEASGQQQGLRLPQSPKDRERQASTIDGFLLEEVISRPEYAPDQVAGYLGMRAVMLGDGAERLSDRQVKALKEFALLGGLVVFSTGTMTLPLKDERWRGWLPVEDVVAGAKEPPLEWGVLPAGEVGWLEGTPAKDSLAFKEAGLTVAWTTKRGLGGVAVLAVDTSEQRLRAASVGARLVSKLASSRSPGAPAWLSEAWSGGGEMGVFPGFRSPAQFGLTSRVSLSPESEAQASSKTVQSPEMRNPFQVTPPSPWAIFGLLVLYWIVLIPIHFGILAKLGRQSMAWITGPLIALGFSIGFFGFAAGLMQAGKSKTQTGMVVTTAGSSLGVYHGSQALFFPRAGNYDLAFSGVKAVWDDPHLNSSAPQMTSAAQATGGMVMGSEVEAPQYSSPNLGFREFGLLQELNLGGGVRASWKVDERGGRKMVVGTVTNDTPYVIEGASVRIHNYSVLLNSGEKIEPGQKASFEQLLDAQLGRRASVLNVYLLGWLDRAPIGSPVFEIVRENDNVMLAASLGAIPISASALSREDRR